jgi:hypothetical protein
MEVFETSLKSIWFANEVIRERREKQWKER